jgi:hypothetical protein
VEKLLLTLKKGSEREIMVKLANRATEKRTLRSKDMLTGHVYRVLSNEKHSLPNPGSILFVILDKYLRYDSLSDKTEHGWGSTENDFEVEEIDIEIKDLGPTWQNNLK